MPEKISRRAEISVVIPISVTINQPHPIDDTSFQRSKNEYRYDLHDHSLDDDNDIYSLANEIVRNDESNNLPTIINNSTKSKRKTSGNQDSANALTQTNKLKRQKLPVCDTFGNFFLLVF